MNKRGYDGGEGSSKMTKEGVEAGRKKKRRESRRGEGMNRDTISSPGPNRIS